MGIGIRGLGATHTWCFQLSNGIQRRSIPYAYDPRFARRSKNALEGNGTLGISRLVSGRNVWRNGTDYRFWFRFSEFVGCFGFFVIMLFAPCIYSSRCVSGRRVLGSRILGTLRPKAFVVGKFGCCLCFGRGRDTGDWRGVGVTLELLVVNKSVAEVKARGTVTCLHPTRGRAPDEV